MGRKALDLSLAGVLLVVCASSVEISRGEKRDRPQGVVSDTPCDRACLSGASAPTKGNLTSEMTNWAILAQR